MESLEFQGRIDARDYPPREKHTAIFRMFESLKPGEQMELTNDHNPKPLQYQFKAEREGAFTWEYLEEGPQVWRIAIGRIEEGD